MKKEIFGIAATMLLIGTMTFTSCSDDCVFGYDEEWDDLVPRTKFNIDQPGDPEYYTWDLGNECMAQALAQSKGWSINRVTIDQYHQLVAELMGESSWSEALQSQYAADVTDASQPGFDTSDSEINSTFGFTNTTITVNGYDFGSSPVTYEKALGERIINGVSHVDYVTKYRPAGNYGLFNTYHEAEFQTANDGWVPVSEFLYFHK